MSNGKPLNNGEFDPQSDPGGLGEFLPNIPDTSLDPLSTVPNPLVAGPPVNPAPPSLPPGGMDPRARTAANLLALLLGAGGLAGVGQNLFGRPPSTIQQPQLSPQQSALLGSAQGQFGQTGSLLQSLLGLLQRPQIPPGLAMLTEQAFQPQFGDLYSQAVNAGRQRGFYDSPATSPPGGAILGPGLANLQGQMAQAKLNLYQNQIGNLLQAFQGSQGLGQAQGALATNLPTQQRTQSPQPNILQTLGALNPLLQTVGGILGATNPRGATGPAFDFRSLLSGLNPFS